MATPTSHYPQSAFIGWLLILAWAPLPLASNRPWALAILILLCSLLALLMVLQSLLRKVDVLEQLKPYRLPVLLLFCVPLWATVQSLELPLSVVQSLAPATAELHRAAGVDSGPLSLEPARTRFMAAWSWALWLFFVSSLLLLDTRDRVRSAAMFIVYCGVFQALYGSFLLLTGSGHDWFTENVRHTGSATGTFVNRNHFAGYLEMCLAIGIGMLVATLNREAGRNWRDRVRRFLDAMLGSKVRLRVFLAFMVIALVLTRSRMGNSAFFGSLVVTGLLLMIMQRKLHKGAVILFASLILVDTLIVGQWFGFDELAERVQSTSIQHETRDEVVRDTLTMIGAHPLTGTGLGSYEVAFSQYQQADVFGFYDHTHNDYLEFSSELGLIGMLPLSMLVIFSLGRAMSAMYARRDQMAKGIAFAATMGILSLLVHSAVDFNLQMPANAQLFTLLLAFAWKAGTMPRDSISAPA